jgi:hypothetical protein
MTKANEVSAPPKIIDSNDVASNYFGVHVDSSPLAFILSGSGRNRTSNPFRFRGERGERMAEPKDWKSWLPKLSVWKSWMPEPKGQGVVKRDWVGTGRIDFATHLNGHPADADQSSEFKLLVEERRIVESIAGNENLEIQWRLATLKEAKAVVTQYHKYLSENSLIKTVTETKGTAAGGSFTPSEER